ncbi:MAG: hypothetical protein ABI758_01705 [Candidatus Woesebacteria bacterium]
MKRIESRGNGVVKIWSGDPTDPIATKTPDRYNLTDLNERLRFFDETDFLGIVHLINLEMAEKQHFNIRIAQEGNFDPNVHIRSQQGWNPDKTRLDPYPYTTRMPNNPSDPTKIFFGKPFKTEWQIAADQVRNEAVLIDMLAYFYEQLGIVARPEKTEEQKEKEYRDGRVDLYQRRLKRLLKKVNTFLTTWETDPDTLIPDWKKDWQEILKKESAEEWWQEWIQIRRVRDQEVVEI